MNVVQRRGTGRATAILLVALVALLLPPITVAVSAAPTPAPATFDLGDFDPALPTFVSALIPPTGRPGPGPLRSIIAEQKGLTLRYRDLAVYLPDGKIARAVVPPLVGQMLSRRASERLIPESDASMRCSRTHWGRHWRTAPRRA